MSHPAALIDKILAMLETDYPRREFRYQIEKLLPGTRMFPDILIFDTAGDMRCAVEIGYTRPEKLTAYRQVHKIPDVRWYDKQGTLHGDVTEKVMRVSVTLEPQGGFAVWLACDFAPCWDEGGCAPIGPDDPNEWDEYCQDAFRDVECFYVTNYAHVWMICHCAKCQRTWMGDRENHDLCGMLLDLAEDTPAELSRQYDLLFRGSWAAVSSYFKELLSLDLNPEDGMPLHKESRSAMLKAASCA
jgi:hypothetical protein